MFCLLSGHCFPGQNVPEPLLASASGRHRLLGFAAACGTVSQEDDQAHTAGKTEKERTGHYCRSSRQDEATIGFAHLFYATGEQKNKKVDALWKKIGQNPPKII